MDVKWHMQNSRFKRHFFTRTKTKEGLAALTDEKCVVFKIAFVFPFKDRLAVKCHSAKICKDHAKSAHRKTRNGRKHAPVK